VGRQIIYDARFDRAVDELGGYRSIDRAIDTVMEALYRNPFGFKKFENDYISFRYAITKRVDEIPPLVIIFVIGENGDVTLEHIEEGPE